MGKMGTMKMIVKMTMTVTHINDSNNKDQSNDETNDGSDDHSNDNKIGNKASDRNIRRNDAENICFLQLIKNMQIEIKIEDQQNKSIITGIISKDQNEDDTTICKKTSDTANKDQYVINLISSLGKLLTCK